MSCYIDFGLAKLQFRCKFIINHTNEKGIILNLKLIIY